jgi:hypothetical protein
MKKNIPQMKFRYATCCIEAKGEDITEMVDVAKDITYRAALRHMTGLLDWARAHGYESRAPGLTLKSDWAVSFHKSIYRGQPCYYLRWSGIEYIWLRGLPQENWGYGELRPEESHE